MTEHRYNIKTFNEYIYRSIYFVVWTGHILTATLQLAHGEIILARYIRFDEIEKWKSLIEICLFVQIHVVFGRKCEYTRVVRRAFAAIPCLQQPLFAVAIQSSTQNGTYRILVFFSITLTDFSSFSISFDNVSVSCESYQFERLFAFFAVATSPHLLCVTCVRPSLRLTDGPACQTCRTIIFYRTVFV